MPSHKNRSLQQCIQQHGKVSDVQLQGAKHNAHSAEFTFYGILGWKDTHTHQKTDQEFLGDKDWATERDKGGFREYFGSFVLL